MNKLGFGILYYAIYIIETIYNIYTTMR